MQNSKLLAEQAPVIRACNKKELAKLYNVSTKTMTRWLKPHLPKVGKREGRYYTIKQVTLIFDLLGSPDVYSEAA